MASSSGDLQLSQRPTAVKHKADGRRISTLNSEATVLNRGGKRTDCPQIRRVEQELQSLKVRLLIF